MTGLCECGCGERTRLAQQTNRARGWIAGQPLRFVHNHHRRKSPVEYVVDENGCWIWQRAVSDGYGMLGVGDRRTAKAYVEFYRRHVGEVPDGHELHHVCRVRLCVNPAHLRPLTRLEHRREHPRVAA